MRGAGTEPRDGAAVTDVSVLKITAVEDAEVVLVDVGLTITVRCSAKLRKRFRRAGALMDFA